MTDHHVDPTADTAGTSAQPETEASTSPPAEIEDVQSTAEPQVSEGRPPVATGVQMKHRNPLAVWIGLPLITLGIYTFVWYYKIHREMADYDRRQEIPVVGPALVLLLLSWTVIAPIVSFHNTGKRIQNAQVSAGLTATCSPTLSWLLWFAFGLNTLYMQLELNKIIESYDGAGEGSQVPLYV